MLAVEERKSRLKRRRVSVEEKAVFLGCEEVVPWHLPRSKSISTSSAHMLAMAFCRVQRTHMTLAHALYDSIVQKLPVNMLHFTKNGSVCFRWYSSIDQVLQLLHVLHPNYTTSHWNVLRKYHVPLSNI